MAERLVLASASPRRVELLRLCDLTFDVRPADLDETPLPNESPLDHVRRLAEAKARAVPGGLVLAADTTVDLDGAILAKPVDSDEAIGMLLRLSGRTHQVHTAVALRSGDDLWLDHATTTVTFSLLSRAEIDRYVASGEPMDKAGAYALQGGAGWFVERIEGSASNVVGLPLHVVRNLLALSGPVCQTG